MIGPNYLRWIIALGAAFLVGAVNEAAEPHTTMFDIFRHGLSAMGPAALALNMQLQKASGQ